MIQGYGFSYNGQHSSAFGIYAKKTTQSITPALLAQATSVPRRPGEWYFRTDIAERWIPVDIAYIASDLASFRPDTRAIAAWLSPVNGLQPLIFDNEPDKTYYAVMDDGMGTGAGTQATDIAQIATLGTGKIIFRCSDPFAYAQSQSSAAFINDIASPSIQGTYETYPVITLSLTGAATSIKITHSSGAFALVNYSFAAGDTLTVDCTRALVTINGATNMQALDITSDFPALTPGGNTLTVSPAGVSTGSVAWTERYL
ncbi:distal tail protein Dit [Alicyclobacillus sp. ALC3]|uniref:distal tail protein Dit n=1 Tax=Alicyclobacillus sp. ALC3 TaxID=2796143 RepID=UPI002379EB78|nr:distal tail protein Dit [Alicyclobacillus sp. ALC3]WDL96411.1 phage tail family protein [Alicyclobacillus sp. ALC3]